jgi:hypothetical protein
MDYGGVMLAASLALSLHLGLAGNFNAIHPALWLEQEGWKAGGYLNSNSELSWFAGRRFGDRAWVEGGLVTGYHVSVMARAGVQLHDRAALWIAPAAKEDGDRGVVLGVEFSLF